MILPKTLWKLISPKTIVILACPFFLCLFVSSQAQDKIKTIQSKIENAASDSIRAEAYIDLGFEYYYFSLDSLSQAMEAAKKSAAIAKKINDPDISITAYNLQSMISREKGDYEHSILMSKKGIEIARKNGFKKRQFQLQDNMANSVLDLGKKDEALTLKLEAYKVFKELKDTTSELTALFGVAYIYMESDDYETAKKHFLRCTKIAPSAPAQIEVDGNLGIIYQTLNQYDSAIYYMKRAEIKGKAYPSFVLQNQVNMAEVYRKKGQTKKALNMLLDIKSEYKENSEERDYQKYKLQIAEYYAALKNWQGTEEALLDLDTSIILNLNKLKRSYGSTGHKLYTQKGNYKRALTYYTYYRDAIDSMENLRRDSSFKLIEEKYESEIKEAKINKQKLKLRNYSLGLGGTLALLLIGTIAFYGYRRKVSLENKLTNEKTEKQLIEIENLKQEVKIISMQSMIEGQEEERKRIARDLHDNIGTLMTSIKMKVLAIQREVQSLEKMNIANELDGMIDNASQQVRRISYSMTPVALDISGLGPAIKDLGLQLTENNIILHANLKALDHITDKNISINIYRILQELVQNIIKHANASEVSIDISERENDLILRIRDNGVGLQETVWDNAKSIGVNNIKSRVNYLNGTVKLISDIGTHFKITIPLNQA